MSSVPFRFVHASDFHLEQPPYGLGEVPEHLRDLFLEAAYTAAGRVFDAALAEDAELLILCGDLVDPQYTGPRGPLFLLDQFARLAQRGVAVYWAGGRVDPPEAWPAALELPGNVHRFPRGRVKRLVHYRDGTPLLCLAGTSRQKQRAIGPGQFDPDPAGLLTVAVAHGEAEASALQGRNIPYWALGGRHERTTLSAAPSMVHYPGSPQGRCPAESGPHGCTLVQIDPQGLLRSSFIPTDAMRWLSERVAIDESTTRAELETRLRDRIHALIETAPKLDLLISWTIVGTGPLMRQLRQGNLAAELLGWLRSEHGYGPPAAWSVSLEAEWSAVLPAEWYEQESICGDFLRAIRRWEMNPEEPLGLESCLPEEPPALGAGLLTPPGEKPPAEPLAAVAEVPDGAARQRLLRQAALLGVELLSAEEGQP